MRIRGIKKAFLHRSINKKIFFGKKVKLYCAGKIVTGKNCKIHNGVELDALSVDGVVLGENVVIGQDTIIKCTGTISHVGRGLRIGNNTSFSNDCYFGCAGGVNIGDNVVGGQFVRFHSENHKYDNLNVPIKEQGVEHEGITIGDNCWIGSGAVFLDGSGLGDGCVVAANAVVTKKFPKNCVIGGVPAKVIKMRGA